MEMAETICGAWCCLDAPPPPLVLLPGCLRVGPEHLLKGHQAEVEAMWVPHPGIPSLRGCFCYIF